MIQEKTYTVKGRFESGDILLDIKSNADAILYLNDPSLYNSCVSFNLDFISTSSISVNDFIPCLLLLSDEIGKDLLIKAPGSLKDVAFCVCWSSGDSLSDGATFIGQLLQSMV